MRGLAPKTEELILHSYRLLEELHPMTLRQLHYAIFSREEIDYENTERDYRRLSRVTTYARRLYRKWELGWSPGSKRPALAIPGAWMVDETRQARRVSVWEDTNEYLETVRRGYRRDNWRDQDNYPEVWAEKGTILGSIAPICREWGITMRVSHGFLSTGAETETGELFNGIDKPITVFYLGDHDPSGRCIEEDIHRRIEIAAGKRFDMERLAIHEVDIKAFNLPPKTIKDKDSRASAFRDKYGSNAPTVELDALPVKELRRRVEEGIKGLIDFGLWNHQVRIQEVELQSINDFVTQFKALQPPPA